MGSQDGGMVCWEMHTKEPSTFIKKGGFETHVDKVVSTRFRQALQSRAELTYWSIILLTLLSVIKLLTLLSVKMASVCNGLFSSLHRHLRNCSSFSPCYTQLKVGFKNLDFIDPVGHLMGQSDGLFSFNGLDSVYSCCIFSDQDFNVYWTAM